MRFRTALAALLPCLLTAQDIAIDWQAALNRIRADSMKGHLSFLASDLLEGRDTPSRGLDIAAEYIAAQFRRAGLEPAGNRGYFHDTEWSVWSPNLDGFECRLYGPEGERTIAGIPMATTDIDVVREPLVPVGGEGEIGARGAVLVMRAPVASGAEWQRGVEAWIKRVAAAAPAAVIVVDPEGHFTRLMARGRLVRPGAKANVGPTRMVFVSSFPESLPPDARVTIRARAIAPQPFALRNVAGLLRGSDASLRDTYIVLTGHYDHVGAQAFGDGDRIFNGANDDASGTTAVLEIAEALSTLPRRPRRSILFLAVGGEEKGMLGSRAFVAKPTVPLESIVANLNLEHLGRPDADNTSWTDKASVTGFDYSTIGPVMAEAGKLLGVEVSKHPQYSDPFFRQSDNLSFAEKGIPAHSICSGFLFAEYHAPGDHWEKIHFDNLEKVSRVVALSLLTMADDVRAPQWNEANQKTESYRKAALGLRNAGH